MFYLTCYLIVSLIVFVTLTYWVIKDQRQITVSEIGMTFVLGLFWPIVIFFVPVALYDHYKDTPIFKLKETNKEKS